MHLSQLRVIGNTNFDTLHLNNGVIFGMNSYTNDITIISPTGDVLHTFNLGFEDQPQLPISDSFTLPSGIYISSCDQVSSKDRNIHQIRIRSDFHDHHHFEVLYQSDSWLANRFAVDSSGNVYILEHNHVKIYRDANNFEYHGGTCTFHLDTVFTSENLITHIAIDAKDTIFLVEGNKLKVYNSDFTQPYHSSFFEEPEEYYSVLCSDHRLYVTKEDSLLSIYTITY